MAEYEIIAEFPQGSMAIYRKRADAARFQLETMIYKVMRSFALLDRPIAHQLIDWAKHLPPPAKGHVYTNKRNPNSEFRFYISRLS